ncbi:PaaI family thioesterase [Granulicoccus sp. GXG6511]|uniref:PaaI family thioesterase n=1 Tax=Granulicoccus sp. GXG6511 TaxID=3381351 RepID=UPI003D7D53B6
MTVPPEFADMHSPLDAKMGFELLELSAEKAVGRMPVEGNTQPFGLWHGGATGVIAETLGSLAANAHAFAHGKIAVGLELNATHHRSARSGWVTGTATALSLGSRIAAYQIELVDDDGRRIATARLTCQLVEEKK